MNEIPDFSIKTGSILLNFPFASGSNTGEPSTALTVCRDETIANRKVLLKGARRMTEHAAQRRFKETLQPARG